MLGDKIRRNLHTCRFSRNLSLSRFLVTSPHAQAPHRASTPRDQRQFSVFARMPENGRHGPDRGGSQRRLELGQVEPDPRTSASPARHMAALQRRHPDRRLPTPAAQPGRPGHRGERLHRRRRGLHPDRAVLDGGAGSGSGSPRTLPPSGRLVAGIERWEWQQLRRTASTKESTTTWRWTPAPAPLQNLPKPLPAKSPHSADRSRQVIAFVRHWDCWAASRCV